MAAAEERYSRVGANSTVMAIGTLASRILGFVRNALFTLIVAMSLANDAFTQANNLPNLIYSLIAAGVISGIFVPQIVKAMKRPDGGEDFINRLLTLSLIVILGVTVAATALVPLIIRIVVASKQADAAGYMNLAVMLGFWCMPQVFFYGLYAVLGQVLNARGHFSAYAWAPLWANIIQIVGLVWFWSMWGKQPDPANWTTGMIVLIGASTTLGIAVQGCCLIIPLYKDGFRFHLRFGWRGYGFGEVSRMSMWTLAGAVVGVVQSLLIGRIATGMRAGAGDYAGPSTMQAASNLYMLPISMIMMSITTALFPAMSSAWRERDNPRMKALVRQGLISPSVLMIPASIAMIGLGVPLIHVLYTVTPDEGLGIWWVTIAFCVGVWANGVTILKQRYYFAKQNGRMNFWLVLVPTITQLVVALVALLMVPARFGIIWIAGGQSLGSIIAAGLFLWLARRDMGDYGLRGIGWLWVRVTIASAMGAGAGWVVMEVSRLGQTTRLSGLVAFALGAVVFCLVYWGASALMRITEVTGIVNSLLARVLRRQVAPVPIEDAPQPAHDDLVQTRVLSALTDNGPTPPPQPWLYARAPMPPPQPWLYVRTPTPPPQPTPPPVRTPPHTQTPPPAPRQPTPPPQPGLGPTPPPQPRLGPKPPPQPWAGD